MSRTIACALISLGLLVIAPAAAPAQQLEGEGTRPGSKVVVRDLKRDDGGTVTLRFQIINDGERPLKTYGVLGDTYAMDHVHLIDAANKKKYLVVTDAAKKCLCSELKEDVAKGARFNLWAKFPAPPENVQKITVIIPSFEPIESVPIAAR